MTWICYRGIELSAETQTVPAERRDPHPRGVLDRRVRQGVQRQRAPGLDARERLVVQPVRPVLQLADPRRAARDLHLLGLGLGRGRQRGVARLGRRAGKGGHPLDDPARPDLCHRHDGRDRRSPARSSSARTRPTSSSRSGHGVFGSPVGQAADHRRPHVGVRVDADDDPADGADDAVDGEVGRDSGGVRQDPSALSDADRLDARDGCALGRVDGRAGRVQHEPERPQRLDHRARLRGLLLLRLHRPRLRLVLPEAAVQEREGLRARRAGAGDRRRDDGLHLRQGMDRGERPDLQLLAARSSASRSRS